MNQSTFPVLFSTPDPEALAERPLTPSELIAVRVFPVARYLLAMGRMVKLNAWYDGLRATQDGHIDRWLAFLRRCRGARRGRQMTSAPTFQP